MQRSHLAVTLVMLACAVACRQPVEKKRFSLVSPSVSNVVFQNLIEETRESHALLYDYFYNGGGVAAGDFNNDGLCDLYFTGNTIQNRLYLNQGKFVFRDVTLASGTQGRGGWKTGVCTVDINHDGWLDLYVSYSGPVSKDNLRNELYINQGCERGGVPVFREEAEKYNLHAPNTYTTQVLFFDFDRDDDLDMFQVNHSFKSSISATVTRIVRNKRHPEYSNRLYRNDEGYFRDVTEQSGIMGDATNSGLSATASDLNGDGWADLYVTNDYEERDYLYLNNRDGTFREVAHQAIGHMAKFSMGSDIADINNDLLPDILVVDMLPETLERQKMLKGADEFDLYTLMASQGFHHQNMRNMLQLNRGVDDDGNLTFSEIGQFADIARTDWSWAVLAADFDNDSNKDIFVTNGYVRDFTNLDFQRYTYQEAMMRSKQSGVEVDAYELIQKMPSTVLPNYCFQSTGMCRYTDVTASWGLDIPMLSFGAAYADLDNDGDLDIISNNTNREASIWENHSNELESNAWIKVRLTSNGKNTQAIGARVVVESNGKQQMREVIVSHGFQSSTEATLHFGMAGMEQKVRIEVHWPSGKRSVLSDADVKKLYELEEPSNTAVPQSALPDNPLLFEDITDRVGVRVMSTDNNFVDFKTQRLILQQYSRYGPLMSKGDVDNNGLDDVYIGGTFHAPGKLLLQYPGQKFSEVNIEDTGAFEDGGSVFFDADGDGHLDLYVVSGGSEAPTGQKELQDRLYLNRGGKFVRAFDAMPAESYNGTCVAASDFDGDGDTDLFVGGGIEPGRFPMSSKSLLLRNDTDRPTRRVKFTQVQESMAPDISSVGIVTDAAWRDMNDDGLTDLVTVGEWTGIDIFANNGKGLASLKQDTLNNSKGLWSSLIIEDVNADGSPDIIAGNFGENLFYHPTPTRPLVVHALDADSDGDIDPVIAIRTDSGDYPIASRDELLEQIPSLKKKFTAYADYAKASITTIFGSVNGNEPLYQVNTLSSCLFLNRGHNRFDRTRLPPESQFSRVSAIVSDDYDGNGTRDLIVAGNFFPFRVQYGRSDASIGVFLSGGSDGLFSVVPHTATGFRADGDVRAMVQLKSETGSIIVVSRNNDHALFYFKEGEVRPGD